MRLSEVLCNKDSLQLGDKIASFVTLSPEFDLPTGRYVLGIHCDATVVSLSYLEGG